MTGRKRLVVVRHGESRTNATHTFQAGNQCESDPLTTRGEAAARSLAGRLADLPVDVVISSGYLRARRTAALIAEATRSPHIVPVSDGESWVDLAADDPAVRLRPSLLREIDVPSELEGMRFDDPRAHTVQRGAMEVADQPDGHYADEENLHDLWHRADAISAYLEARAEELLVVVAHGGILKVWLAHLMFTSVHGLDTASQLSAYRGFTKMGWWDNTGVVSLIHDPRHGWQWLMTDIAHLGPEYLAFMAPAPPPAPDTGAGYLGSVDD